MSKAKVKKAIPGTIPEALARFEQSEHTALICGDEKLSYQELLSDAKHIAHALMARGVKKGDRIVLDMSRSADYVRMYLGVIFTGAIQVTLHSGWPKSQRDRVIADCAPVLIVDDAAARELRCAPVRGSAADCPLSELKGSDPFQICYTSGSTGAPKGAVNFHSFPVRQLIFGDGAAETCLLPHVSRHSHRILMDANLAFVVASMQLFLALLNGKTLVLATQQELGTASALAACIRRRGVDTLWGVMSRYSQYLTDADFASAVSGIRMLILAGERTESKVMDTLQDATGALVYDLYASSESYCMIVWQYQGNGRFSFEEHLNDLPVYLLSEQSMDLVPAGEPGEICIGGPAGKLGCYWNNPELTAQKYMEHPLYGRLFRTGDRARLDADGLVRILGRLDSMTKLHGQRIELGAIESAMADVSGVRRAAVKIQGEGAKAVLCGYYSGTVEEGALRRALAESLPYYMVPAFLRKLPELPLNQNGKLDRSALPPIQLSKGNYVPPETETEKLLCEAFRKVLQQDTSVGIDDSFFELGGDSIRGMTIGALVREQGYKLKVEWIFAAPTPRALAQMLRPLAPEEDTGETLWSMELSERDWQDIDRTVGRNRVETVYPVLTGMREYLHWNSPFWLCSAFLVPEELTPRDLRRRLSESVRCHQVLRTLIVGRDKGESVQVVLKEWETPFFTVDLRALASSSDDDSRLSEKQEAYLWNLSDLYQKKPMTSEEVMFEAVFIRISEKRSVLMLAGSHLLFDGTGFRRIQEELLLGIPIESDVCQYNRYIRRLMSAEYRQESLRVWRRHLAERNGLSILRPVFGKEENCARTLVAGTVFAEEADLLCRKKQITFATLVSLALGRTLMALCGTAEAGFFSAHSGRSEENAQLTGMFSLCAPIFVTEKDSLFSVQEQLVRVAGYPIPEQEIFPSGAGALIPDYSVCLSMQNYIHATALRDLYYSLNPTLRRPQSAREPGIHARKQLAILVSPYAPFRITLVYSHVCFDDALANRLGRQLLKELRRIVSGEIDTAMPETGG